MTGWVIRKFAGTAPRIEPKLLPDNLAQSANNCVLTSGILRPLKANTTISTLPKSGTIQSIHRFGQDSSVDTSYWFHWASDVDVARGPIFGDTQERTYFTGAALSAPQVTDNSIALTGGTQYPMNSYDLGVPTPTAAPGVTVGGTGVGLAESRVYVVTFVSSWGEEGSSSSASVQVNVLTGQTVDLTLPAVPSGAYHFSSKRIYRSVAGTTGATYLFVEEVASTAMTYTDYKLAASLGEVLPSLGHFPPPAGMQGLTPMPNGIMAGFLGRDVYFSEPYKPHAWPLAYSMTVDSPIVGLGVFGTTLLVLTRADPFVISGSDPSNFTMVRAEGAQACMAKRSIVGMDGGVIYAAPDGLFMAGSSGFRNLTENLFTKVEWQLLAPATLQGFSIGTRYIGFGVSSGFIFDLQTGDYMPLDWAATAGFYEAKFNTLYLVTGTNQLVRFDAGTNLSMTWKSKPFYVARATNLTSARVEAKAYPVTARIYADGALVHTQTVASDDVFRLPGGFRANTWNMEVVSTVEVTSMGMAESVMELSDG